MEIVSIVLLNLKNIFAEILFDPIIRLIMATIPTLPHIISVCFCVSGRIKLQTKHKNYIQKNPYILFQHAT